MSCEFVRVKLSKTRPYVRQTFYDHRSIDICVDKLSDDQLVDLFNSIEISEEHPQDQRTLSRRLEKPKDTEVKVIRRAKENKYVASVDWKIELSRFEKRYAAPDPNEDELEPIRIEEYDEVDSNDELTFCEQKKDNNNQARDSHNNASNTSSQLKGTKLKNRHIIKEMRNLR